MITELRPVTFLCEGDTLVGILHVPERPEPRAVVIVPGAPQYRVGSHRQFLLLARDLSECGFAVLRFDYRGMGDSDGSFRSFEEVDADLGSAIDTLLGAIPDAREVVLVGLCDGASAICFYAHRDPRVKAVVLINPWVREQESLAPVLLRRYYASRLASRAFWVTLLGGQIRLAALRAFLRALGGIATKRAARLRGGEEGEARGARLADRLSSSLRRYEGRILLVLSGADLTAGEFAATVLEDKAVRKWLKTADVETLRLEGANHTYSKSSWRSEVHRTVIAWLRSGAT